MGKTVFMFQDRDPNILAWEKEFYEQIPICKEVYDLASEVTGLDIPALCFEGERKNKYHRVHADLYAGYGSRNLYGIGTERLSAGCHSRIESW